LPVSFVQFDDKRSLLLGLEHGYELAAKTVLRPLISFLQRRQVRTESIKLEWSEDANSIMRESGCRIVDERLEPSQQWVDDDTSGSGLFRLFLHKNAREQTAGNRDSLSVSEEARSGITRDLPSLRQSVASVSRPVRWITELFSASALVQLLRFLWRLVPSVLLGHILRLKLRSWLFLQHRIQFDTEGKRLSHTVALERSLPSLYSDVPIHVTASLHKSKNKSTVQVSANHRGVRLDCSPRSRIFRLTKNLHVPFVSKVVSSRLTSHMQKMREKWSVHANAQPILFPPPPAVTTFAGQSIYVVLSRILRYVVDAQVAGLEALLSNAVRWNMILSECKLRCSEQMFQIVENGARCRFGFTSAGGILFTGFFGCSWLQMHVTLANAVVRFEVTALHVISIFTFDVPVPSLRTGVFKRFYKPDVSPSSMENETVVFYDK
jgi:hypothetical protein